MQEKGFVKELGDAARGETSWEYRVKIIIFTAVAAAMLMFVTLARGPVSFWDIISALPVLLVCFLFAIVCNVSYAMLKKRVQQTRGERVKKSAKKRKN